jgi:DNA invertase Pin-like site-specific DNA recombinase
MPSQKKLPATAVAYSYIRFSSPEQARGDSLRRQTELRNAWLEKTGVFLDTSLTLRDEGVSAFSGAHRENPDRNALAAFLALVKKKRIARGSYLIVESLDRLTREHIRSALTLLLDLIDHGIRVVQLLPVEAVYDENVEPMAIMQAIMELSRGHSESRMKSERVSRAWSAKRARAAETGQPMTGMTPGWLKVAGGKFVVIEDRAEIVRRIYKMAIAGHGLTSITRTLNGEKVPTIGRAKYWGSSFVHKLLKSRAVLGELQPHKSQAGEKRKAEGKVIKDYYPAITSSEVWYAARAAMAGRKEKRGRRGKRVYLFSGLLRDARDQGPIHVAMKGRKSVGPTLVSTNAMHGIRGSKYVSFPLAVFEAAVLSQLKEIDPRDILPGNEDAGNRVQALTGQLHEIESRIERLKAALFGGTEVESVVDVLRKLEDERRAVAGQLDQARREEASPLSKAWSEARSLLDVLEDATDANEVRTRLRAAIRRLVSAIWCLFVAGEGTMSRRHRLAAVQIWFQGGAHRDYLILYQGAAGNVANRERQWWVRSFADVGAAGGFDLRQKGDAAALEKALAQIPLPQGERAAQSRRAASVRKKATAARHSRSPRAK